MKNEYTYLKLLPKQKAVRVILTLVLLLFCSPLFSQVNTDSLREEMNRLPDDTASLRRMINLVSSYRRLYPDAALLVAKEAEKKASRMHNEYYVSRSLLNTGIVYMDLSRSPEATAALVKARQIAEKIQDPELILQCIAATGAVYYINKEHTKALEYFNEALALSEKINHRQTRANMLNNIAGIYYDQSGRKDSAGRREHLLKAIAYAKRSVAMVTEMRDSTKMANQMTNLTLMYLDAGETDSALLYHNRVKQLLDKRPHPYTLCLYYSNAGKLARAQEKYGDAVMNYKKAIEFAQKINNPEWVFETWLAIAETYEAAGDDKNALTSFRTYTALRDSAIGKENFAKAADIENKYEREKKDNEITRLNAAERIRVLQLEKQKAIIAGNLQEATIKEQEIAFLSQQKELQDLRITEQNKEMEKTALQAKLSSQQLQLKESENLVKEKKLAGQKTLRTYLLTGLGLLALFSFFLVRTNYARKKAYKKLEEKNSQIKEQALQLSKQAKTIAKFQSQMNPHFTFNALHNIYGLVATNDNEKAVQQIQSLAGLMRQTLTNSVKEEITLEEEIKYLQKYIDFEKATSPVNFDFRIVVDKELEDAVIPPMMLQPFIENSIKHGELDKISHPFIKVLIEKENDMMKLVIEDNGRGVNKTAQNMHKATHSVSILKSRIEMLLQSANKTLSDYFTIRPFGENGTGTVVKFYLPLNFTH